MIDWGYVSSNSDEIYRRLLEHLQLTGIALFLGLAISLPLGIYSYRHRRAYGTIAGVTGVLYTIPSLALFAFLQPYTGLSVTTAEIGLVGYTLLILIRNTVSGLDGVPEDAREAAVGMGFSSRQLLWRVELPLALPVIITGIRIATVTTVGLVTVTAMIGMGGLGHFILVGLRGFGLRNTATLIGAILSVALAVGADGLLVLAEKLLTPWARRRSSVV